MAVMTNKKFVEKCVDIAKNHKTLYVLGCFGAPLNGSNVTRYTNNYPYNKKRQAIIKGVANTNTFGFDCVCLIKGILWGWNGNTKATYGGAKYGSNGVPDIGADTMIKKCTGVSTDFSKIEIGEAVWKPGHIGVYIGDGLAVECTPSWKNKVQITACNCTKSGYNRRDWVKHGKLPYLEYVKETAANDKPSAQTKPAKSDQEIAAKSVVTINKGAVYGGLGTARGKAVPSGCLAPKQYTVSKIQTNKGVKEALLVGINSWVAVSSLTLAEKKEEVKKVTKGCKVKVNKGAKSYTGASIASFVYNKVYTVDQLKGDRAVLDKDGLCTAFNVKDLTVQ